MSFLNTVLYNMIVSAAGLLFSACTGLIILKNIHFVRRKGRYGSLVFVFLYIIAAALLAAVFFKAGILRNSVGEILLSYLTLAGNAFCISLFFEERYRLCWGIVIFEGIVNEFSEMISMILISEKPFNISVPEERTMYLLGNLVIGPALFILTLYLLYKMRVGSMCSQWLENSDSWSRGMICLSIYPILKSGLFNFFINRGMSRNSSLIMMLLVVCGLLVVFNYMGREEQRRKEFAAQQMILQQQNAYIEMLEGMQEEMRRFRHDYKNMISGMYLKAKEGDFARLQNFIQEMTNDFDSQIGGQIRRMSQLQNIYMSEVKGLLLMKLAEMNRDGTACELEVMHPFYGTEFRTIDLCRCLGILIDNAMDEVRGRKDARIHIMISSRDGCTTFRVKNPLYHPVDVHRIWQQDYSTRGAQRGIGLASYKKILERYNNVLPVTAVSEGFFIQELKIQEKGAPVHSVSG